MAELILSSYTTNQMRTAINDVFSGTATFNLVTAINLYSPFTTLTDDTTITWDLSQGLNAFVTLGGNRTLVIIGAANGCRGTIFVQQDGTGNRTLTLGGFSTTHVVKDGGLGAVILTASANAIDKLSFFCKTGFGQSFYWKVERNFT